MLSTRGMLMRLLKFKLYLFLPKIHLKDLNLTLKIISLSLVSSTFSTRYFISEKSLMNMAIKFPLVSTILGWNMFREMRKMKMRKNKEKV